TWDEFLHRYYKPVADACITGGIPSMPATDCVDARAIPVGQSLTLSGDGSSDPDGPEDTAKPAHQSLSKKHYFWDFNTSVDSGGALTAYANGVEYTSCPEDCDRNATDGPDDDNDATGVQV
ncbi:MAG: hypothetical protein ABIQ99_07940, partial [Thermoflexales bacterium]